MTEDVSNAIMLSVTVCLLCMLIMAVVNQAIIGRSLQSNFVNRYVQSVHSARNSVIASMKDIKNIGAPSAYKMIEEHRGNIASVKINYLDGTATADYSTLLKRASSIVNIKIEKTSNNVLNVDIEEVDK